MADITSDRSTFRALIALLLIVPAPSVGVWAAMIAWPDTTHGQVIYVIGKAWMFLLPLLWLLLVDRERLSLSPPRKGGFGVAVALGLVISGVILGAYFLFAERMIDLDHVRNYAKGQPFGTPAGFLLLAAYLILVNSVLEEYAFRWFIFRKCEVLMPGALAVLAAAACFTVHHVLAVRVQMGWGVTLLASTGVFIGSAVWSWLYLRYRSIWPCYVSHAIVDIAVYIVGWRILFGS